MEISPEDATEELVRLITKGDLDALKEQIVPRNNLPSPASSFIGRAAAISELKVQLGDPACRLLTLTGPGGVGKTRLAIEVSRSTLNLFADGVYFVALGDLPSSDFLVPAIASALCLNFDTIATHWGALDQLNHFLNPCKMLLVLDEFEGLLDQSSLISDLLRSAPGLKILVTSRQKLDLPGEWIYLLDGLSSSSTDTEALDLFQTRARQIDNSISFEGDERESALHICELVDGLPLGIELAASWTSVLTCSEIATEIEKGNGLLLTSSRSLPEKNRSLNATFDQSWHRLSAEQKKLFSHLSVFEGSFTRKAAKEVAGATLANLSALLNRSLISRNSAGRLEMHKVIRQYSGLKLSESIQEWSAVNQKCSQFYLELLASHEEDLNGPNMARARELLRHEVLNLQAAMNWAVEHGEQEQVLDHLSNYFSFYLVHGWHQGVVAFEQLGKLIRTLRGHTQLLHDQVYLFVQTHLGYFLANLGRTIECEDICQECVESLKELKLVEDLAMCLHNLGVCAEFRGEYLLSQRFLEQAIEIGKEYPSNAYFSYFLWVGYVYFLVGEYEAGMQSFMICYQWWRDRDTKWAAAYALSKMGLASVGLGLHEDALAYYREAMEIFVDTGDVGGQAYSLSRMSVGSNFLEDYDQAVNYAAESLSLFQDIGHRWGICAAYSHLGFANLGQGELKVAEENFLSALERSVRYQLSPLVLYALCGVACTLALANNSDLALQIFTFARSHPKTPSLYITMAGRWIENSIHIREELSDKFRDRSIAEVVNDVLANMPIADQHK